MNDEEFAAYVRECLNYDAETGDFRWLQRPGGHFKDARVWKMWNTTWAGKSAGCRAPAGYILVGIDRKLFYAHRLAWLWTHGRWPDRHIDHVNGDKSDNRLCNLREATYAENNCNTVRPSHNTTGFKGVSKHQGKHRAVIQHRGRHHFLGYFATAEEAHEAYAAAAKRLHGEFARIN